MLAQLDEAVAQLDRLDRDGHYTDQAKFLALFLRGQEQAMRVQAEAWCERHPRPTAFGGLGAVQLMQGEFDAAAESLQPALRLSPRDPMRADWQHRLAMAHLAPIWLPAACRWPTTGRSALKAAARAGDRPMSDWDRVGR